MDFNYRPQKYREWLDNRFNDEVEDDEELDVLDVDEIEEDLSDDGFPLHDRYDEESSP